MNHKMKRKHRLRLTLLSILVVTGGCATLYQPAIDYAVDRALVKVKDGLTDAAGEAVAGAVRKIATISPTPPPSDSDWWDEMKYVLAMAGIGAASGIDRRFFHKKNRT